MQWLITYTSDYNQTQHTEILKASTYTEAYLYFSLCNDSIILDIKKI